MEDQCSQRELKHLGILSVLEKLGNRTGDLEKLIAQLAGTPSEPEPKTAEDRNTPSLREFLDEMPSRLQAIVDRLVKAEETLREAC